MIFIYFFLNKKRQNHHHHQYKENRIDANLLRHSLHFVVVGCRDQSNLALLIHFFFFLSFPLLLFETEEVVVVRNI
jgi:hypothetical protein